MRDNTIYTPKVLYNVYSASGKTLTEAINYARQSFGVDPLIDAKNYFIADIQSEAFQAQDGTFWYLIKVVWKKEHKGLNVSELVTTLKLDRAEVINRAQE